MPAAPCRSATRSLAICQSNGSHITLRLRLKLEKFVRVAHGQSPPRSPPTIANYRDCIGDMSPSVVRAIDLPPQLEARHGPLRLNSARNSGTVLDRTRSIGQSRFVTPQFRKVWRLDWRNAAWLKACLQWTVVCKAERKMVSDVLVNVYCTSTAGRSG